MSIKFPIIAQALCTHLFQFLRVKTVQELCAGHLRGLQDGFRFIMGLALALHHPPKGFPKWPLLNRVRC